MSSTPGFATFYVDDSTCEIAGRRHFILAAVNYGNWEDKIAAEWIQEKAKFGLPPYEEVRWNSRKLRIEQRRAFVPIASAGTGLVVIDDNDKQHAAMVLAEQVCRFCRESNAPGFRLRFDENIVTDWNSLRMMLHGLPSACVGLCQADSRYEQLLQAADFLAGSVKLSIDLGLGKRDRNERILLASELAEGYGLSGEEGVELGWFMFASLRHCIWGEVSAMPERPYEPWKKTLGRGVPVQREEERERSPLV